MSDYAWCERKRREGWVPLNGDPPHVHNLKALVSEMALALIDPLPEKKRDELLEKAKKAIK
jgi:hypothetical protein